MSAVEVRIPDLGDVKGVTVLEVLVKAGSKVAREDPLISLESDKAAMDVPSPVSGVIQSLEIKKGDSVSSGTLIAMVEPDAAAPPKAASAATAQVEKSAPAQGKAAAAPSVPAAAPQAAAAAPSVPAAARQLPLPSPRPNLQARLPKERSTWWCSVPVWAATQPLFAPRIWASKSR